MENYFARIFNAGGFSVLVNLGVTHGEKVLIDNGLLSGPLIGENRLFEAERVAGTGDIASLAAFLAALYFLRRKKSQNH